MLVHLFQQVSFWVAPFPAPVAPVALFTNGCRNNGFRDVLVMMVELVFEVREKNLDIQAPEWIWGWLLPS